MLFVKNAHVPSKYGVNRTPLSIADMILTEKQKPEVALFIEKIILREGEKKKYKNANERR